MNTVKICCNGRRKTRLFGRSTGQGKHPPLRGFRTPGVPGCPGYNYKIKICNLFRFIIKYFNMLFLETLSAKFDLLFEV